MSIWPGKQVMTPEEHLAQAKKELAQGNPDIAQAHALIALAEWTQPRSGAVNLNQQLIEAWEAGRTEGKRR